MAKPFTFEHLLGIRVVDGDTVHVVIDLGFGIYKGRTPESDGDAASIRIAGIDAPEMRGEHRETGKLVTEALRLGYFRGRDASEFNLISHKVDKYGRVIGDLQLKIREHDDPNWSLANWMVEQGLAVRIDEARHAWTPAELVEVAERANEIIDYAERHG